MTDPCQLLNVRWVWGGCLFGVIFFLIFAAGPNSTPLKKCRRLEWSNPQIENCWSKPHMQDVLKGK